ncbi:phage structural protein [Lysinibacillus fusiformis]|uniref:phage structural protein n=1 Tax=Lysinibacillus fusiformis TaxID=28031 RepID=UPI003D006A59
MPEIFNFKDTVAIVGGIILTGFMDGTPIEAEKNEDTFSQHVGADGSVTYNESADETGTFTFTIKQDSSVVPMLDALLKSKESFNVSLNDAKRKKRVNGLDCHFSKNPNFSRGAEVEGIEYTILAAQYKED